MRAVALIAVAAAIVFAGLIVVNVRGGGGGDQPTAVLGKSVERSTTSSSVGAVPTTPPTSAAPAVVESTVPTQPPTTSSTALATTSNDAFFDYRPDPSQNTSGSSLVITPDQGPRVELEATGTVDGDQARIHVSVRNDSGRAIAFPDGLRVTVSVRRDGAVWKTLELSDPSVVRLDDGGQATLDTQVTLDGYGHYTLSGEVRYAEA